MREKAYIILGKKKDGTYLGYVEHSFSMSYDKSFIRLWRLNNHFNISNIQKDVDKLNKRTKDIEWAIYRVGTKKCPVQINWRDYHIRIRSGKITSFYMRNLQFTVKNIIFIGECASLV